jgi:hypothetical protein
MEKTAQRSSATLSGEFGKGMHPIAGARERIRENPGGEDDPLAATTHEQHLLHGPMVLRRNACGIRGIADHAP